MRMTIVDDHNEDSDDYKDDDEQAIVDDHNEDNDDYEDDDEDVNR